MPTLNQLKKELNNLANPTQAKNLAWFFKTGKGEYGEGDIFLGIKVPVQRAVVKKYVDLNLQDIEKLFLSKIHEYRLSALLILMAKYKKGNAKEKEDIFKIYLKNTKNINNWDLVDLSAPKIVGEHLLHNHPFNSPPFDFVQGRPLKGGDKRTKTSREILYKLARSKNFWERRIAIISTFAFIHVDDFRDTLKISEILVFDSHDLIHKAVGWALREVGKRNLGFEEEFLKKYYHKMPRTMLRYAIEKFPENKRKFYLKK